MAAGRSFRWRSLHFSSLLCLSMLMVSLCCGEVANSEQKEENDIQLNINDVHSTGKQDDSQLTDPPPPDVKLDAKPQVLTQPDATQPDLTQQDATQPEPTKPDLTQQDATQPEPTQPESTQQEFGKEKCDADGGCSQPIVDTPPGTKPAEDQDIPVFEEIISDSVKETIDKINANEQRNDEKKAEEHQLEDNKQDGPNDTNLTSLLNDTADGANSSMFQWIKFILDPIIEEFKDGIYPKLTEKVNSSETNVTVANESMSVNIESANDTMVELNNTTDTETNTTESGKKVKFECTGRNVTDNVNATVKLITTAKLLQLLNFDKNDTDNVTDCLLVMFYAPWCHFCAKIAPHYNALARAFPQLDFVAVDTAQFSNLLARFGTVSVPNILVFHQSRAAVKFNQTDRTFENFVTFVTNSTGLEANKTVNVTEVDYLGPVPSVPTNEPDYLLLVSWIFVIFCSTYMFIKSHKGQQWINRVKTLWVLWQEHQHID